MLHISVGSIEVVGKNDDFADFTDLISDAKHSPSGSAPPVCEIMACVLAAWPEGSETQGQRIS